MRVHRKTKHRLLSTVYIYSLYAIIIPIPNKYPINETSQTNEKTDQRAIGSSTDHGDSRSTETQSNPQTTGIL